MLSRNFYRTWESDRNRKKILFSKTSGGNFAERWDKWTKFTTKEQDSILLWLSAEKQTYGMNEDYFKLKRAFYFLHFFLVFVFIINMTNEYKSTVVKQMIKILFWPLLHFRSHLKEVKPRDAATAEYIELRNVQNCLIHSGQKGTFKGPVQTAA